MNRGTVFGNCYIQHLNQTVHTTGDIFPESEREDSDICNFTNERMERIYYTLTRGIGRPVGGPWHQNERHGQHASGIA